MQLDYSRVGDVTILDFHGELDAFNLAPMAQAVDDVIARGEVKLCFNLKRLSFINSSGLGYLMQARKKAAAAGGDVVLVQPGKFVRKVLATLGLDKLMKIYDSEEAGIAHYSGGDPAQALELADEEIDETLSGANAILFTLKVAGRHRKLVGRITSLYANGLKFRWEVPGWSRTHRPPVSTANFDKEIQPGMRFRVKFRQPFMVKGHYFEFDTRVGRVTREILDDGTNEAHFVLEYENASAEDTKLLRRFVSDMEMFRKELEDLNADNAGPAGEAAPAG